MDLLLVALVIIALIILAIRRRRRGSRSDRTSSATRDWSFSRHPREDWRYWRDLAILLGLALVLLITVAILASIERG